MQSFFEKESAMQASSVWKALEWMHQYKLKVSIQTLFQTAYTYTYGEASPRCQWCLDLFLAKGVVPEFVVFFIKKHFISKGE